MRVGITIDRPSAPVALQARRAEEAGFDFVASGEHLFFHGPVPNAFVVLAAAAGATERIRLLSALTLLPLYPAALAAKMAATLDVVSHGRFELGVGVGGEYPPEFEAVGVPVHERGRRTDLALETIIALFRGEGAEPRLDPLPVQRPGPPIVVGGRREAAQRRAGRFGQAWMPYLVTPEQLNRGLARAREVAATHGRPPVTGALYAWTAVDPDARRARRIAVEVVSRVYRQDFGPLADAFLVTGTPEQVSRRLREYAEAGAERILLAPACEPDDTDMLPRLAAEVVPQVRG